MLFQFGGVGLVIFVEYCKEFDLKTVVFLAQFVRIQRSRFYVRIEARRLQRFQFYSKGVATKNTVWFHDRLDAGSVDDIFACNIFKNCELLIFKLVSRVPFAQRLFRCYVQCDAYLWFFLKFGIFFKNLFDLLNDFESLLHL